MHSLMVELLRKAGRDCHTVRIVVISEKEGAMMGIGMTVLCMSRKLEAGIRVFILLILIPFGKTLSC